MAKLNLEQLQQALQKIAASIDKKEFSSILTQEESEQVALSPDLINVLSVLKKLEIKPPIGGFISAHTAIERQSNYGDFLTSIREILGDPGELGPLVDFKHLGCSASLAKKLLVRSSDNDFLQISLGMVDHNLTFLMAIVDSRGVPRLGHVDILNKSEEEIEAVDEDYLDDMRPCPPCN